MRAWIRIAGQFVVVTAVIAAVAELADWPRYTQLPPSSAVIKLSFTHGPSRKSECRRRTPEELVEMPKNMRQLLDCPRSRNSIYVELDVDGQQIYRASLAPSGIADDGPARVYERFVVRAGSHAIAVRMRETARTEGFDHVRISDVSLSPDQNFVIDFRSAEGFVFR